MCPLFGAATSPGTVAGLSELSGLAASRAHPGVLWALEDSGHPAELHARSASGVDLGAYVVDGATNRDWEELAATPDGLYVADIGDNRGRRPTVTVYRVPEPATAPSGGGGHLRATATYTLRYPDGPADAEAIVVDPRSHDLYVLTKFDAHVLRAPAADLASGGTVTLVDEGEVRLDLGTFAFPGDRLITGADISPDGSAVLVRTYGRVFRYARGRGATVGDALRGKPCGEPTADEVQGEAIAFTADGTRYLTASEGDDPALHLFVRAAAPPAVEEGPNGRDLTWVPPVALAVGVLVVLLLGWSRLRRQRMGDFRRARDGQG